MAYAQAARKHALAVDISATRVRGSTRLIKSALCSEHAAQNDDGAAGEVHAIAMDRRAHEAPPRAEACSPMRLSRPRSADHNGASAVWALPVTGSSGMPSAGAKKRETKS